MLDLTNSGKKVKMTFENGSSLEFSSIAECAKKHFKGSNKAKAKITSLCNYQIKKKPFLMLDNEKVTFKFA